MHGLFGGPLSLGALGPGPAGPLDKTALARGGAGAGLGNVQPPRVGAV